jgi:protein-S-isoprenylcysteine O-methyltransferase Ste14
MHRFELRIPPLVLLVMLGALMFVVARWGLPSARVAWPGSVTAAALFGTAGVAGALAGVMAFRQARTSVNPLRPAVASQLVVRGIYRRTRNPMYLGMLVLLMGWGVFLAHPVALALAFLFVPVINVLQIRPEERALAVAFGTDYEGYVARVPRWL